MSVDMKSFNWDALPVKTGATADPGAATDPAEITFAKRTLFMGGRCSIVRDATPANIYAYLNIKRDATNVDNALWHGTAITANQTVAVDICAGVVNFVAVSGNNNVMGIPSPGIEIPAGGKLQLKFFGIQGADNVGVFRYAYKEAPA